MQTDRTYIIPMLRKHFPDILEMYFEKDSWKYISPHDGKDLDYYTQFLEGKLDANKKEVGVWSVYHRNGEFIGTVNLNQFMNEPIKHMGVHLSNKFWGKGYGKELMQRLLQYALEELIMEEVYAILVPDNNASKRIFLGLGFYLKERREVNGELLEFYVHK